jgi:hypothetical protein
VQANELDADGILRFCGENGDGCAKEGGYQFALFHCLDCSLKVVKR